MDDFGNTNSNSGNPSDNPKSRFDALTEITAADIKEFLIKPFVIARLLCLFCCLVVVCCISSEGWEKGFCKFNFVSSTCHFGTVLGALSIIITIAFLLVDTHFDKIPTVLTKKYVIIGDFATQGFLSFLWFASFCDMADKWRRTTVSVVNLGGGHHTVQAAIAFAFFSIVAFAASAFFALNRYKFLNAQQDHVDPSANHPYNPNDFTLPNDDITP